jgi:hypothetical protein
MEFHTLAWKVKKFHVSMESKEIPYVSMDSKEIPCQHGK